MRRTHQSTAKVKAFLLARLSVIIFSLNGEMTQKEIAAQADCDPSLISLIKNGACKSISIDRLLFLMNNLHIDYSIHLTSSGGVLSEILTVDDERLAKVFGRKYVQTPSSLMFSPRPNLNHH